MFNETTGVLLSTTKFHYNAVGALSKKTTTEGSNTTVINYGYNNDDQLITLKKTVNGKVVEDLLYEYDQDGNRLSKTKLLEHSHFHYHRDTNGEIFSITKETGGVPESVSNFYRDADGNLLSMRYNEIVYYYQFNARGDVIALTDSAGIVAATYEYDEWGNITSMTGDQALANANPYRFVGKYGVHYDQDANLYLMGWRDYDPSIGRFIVQDEYEGAEDEPSSLNRYLYADADPVNNIDPDGHAPKWMQKGWKSTKKYAKKGYNFAIGDDIRTLRSPKSKWYHKAGAAASIASNFIPGAAPAKLALKAGKGVKVKKLKKFYAPSVKKSRTIKVQAKQVQKVKNSSTKKRHVTVPKKTNNKSVNKESKVSAKSSAQFQNLKTHYKQTEKYGKAEVRELSDGRIRYYGKVSPAKVFGEMAGRRVVREWNPATGRKRTWHETLDHNGSIRQVRPEVELTGGKKVHYRFDKNGKYIGKW